MKKDVYFPDAIECFYNSLADSIRTRIKDLGLTRADVLPSDPKRVTAIVNNRRDKKYPYLIGAREYNKIHNIFKFHTKKEVAEQGFDENDFIQIVEEYEEDKKNGTKGLIQKEKFSDPNNYDDMLWGHIDWEKIFHCLMKNIQNLNHDDDLYITFEQSLLDYVPYAIDAAHFEKSTTNPHSNFFQTEPPVYFPFESESPLTGEIEIENELVFGDEIFNQLEKNKEKAIEWVYMKEKQTIITNLKKEFLHAFKGKRLQKFDREFDMFLSDIMLKIIKDKQPNQNSFGLQAYYYMKELLESEFMNEQIDFSYNVVESHRHSGWDEVRQGFYPDYSDVGDVTFVTINVLKNYIQFAKKHLEGLQKFQLEFEKARIF